MAHGERSPPPSPASLSDICVGRWRLAGEGLTCLDGLSLIRTWLRLCGGGGRPMGRTDGDKRLFLARSHPFVRPHRRRHSIGQSIDFLRRPDASDGIADSVDICKRGGATSNQSTTWQGHKLQHFNSFFGARALKWTKMISWVLSRST